MLKSSPAVVVRVIALSYLYRNNILETLKSFTKIPITFFQTTGLSGRNLINIATDLSGLSYSKEFRDTHGKFKDGTLMLIDTTSSPLYKT